MAEPEFLAEGDEARKRVAELKDPMASSVTVNSTLGSVEIKAGMQSWDKLRLVVYADGAGVAYLEGDKLFKMPAADFVRDEQIRCFEKAGKSAKPWIKIWKIEVDFICSVVIPWWGMIPIKAAEGALFYSKNKELVDDLNKHAKTFLTVMAWFKTFCPKLYDRMIKSAGWAVLKELPTSIDIPTISKFIGRMLYALRQLKNPKDKAMVMTLTAKVLAKTVLFVASAVLALKLPNLTANAIMAASKQVAKKVQDAFKERGITIDLPEAEEISREILLRQTVIKAKVDELVKSAEQLEPLFEKAQKAYEDL